MESEREKQAVGRLALALRPRLGDALAAWERDVRRDIAPAAEFTPAELRDQMPDAITRLCDALDGGGFPSFGRLPDLTVEHGTRRFGQRYAVPDLLAEYGLLRQSMFVQASLALPDGLTGAEVLTLNRAVDAVCQGAMTAFADAQRSHVERAAEVEAKFLAFLAHDQRNHLNHAMLLLELHTAELSQHPELVGSIDDLREVREAIRQTTHGMERLMQAERLRRGTVEAERTAVHPAELVRSIVASFAAEATGKGVCVEAVASSPSTLRTDPALLSLVLNNLVGNAVKFSTGGVVRVSAEPVVDEGGWWFAVADQGPGIATEQVGKLFDAFVRGETHGQAGMGLGLSIASQATRLLGGRLTVASQVGVGSTFTLTIPST